MNIYLYSKVIFVALLSKKKKVIFVYIPRLYREYQETNPTHSKLLSAHNKFLYSYRG